MNPCNGLAWAKTNNQYRKEASWVAAEVAMGLKLACWSWRDQILSRQTREWAGSRQEAKIAHSVLAVGQVRQTRSSLWIPAIWSGAVLFILYTTTYKWLLPQWFEVAEHATPVERGLTQPYSQCAYSHALLLCNSPSQTRQTAVQHTSKLSQPSIFPDQLLPECFFWLFSALIDSPQQSAMFR